MGQQPMRRPRQPLIGITTYGRNADNHFTLPAEYVDSVRRAGGQVVLLPPGDSALLTLLDGVILAGGGDIDPARYNGQRHEAVERVDPERDAMELDLAHQLTDDTRPVLCVCRGMQVLNVALGGTLIEHLPAVVGEQVSHRTDLPGPIPHEVLVAPESWLASLMGQTVVSPPSWHHQALKQVAPGLTVVARAPDGTIEAVEMPDHPWLVAVQWHPELSAATDVSQQRLFDAFVEAAHQRHVSVIQQQGQ